MLTPKRGAPLFGIIAFVVTLIVLQSSGQKWESWRSMPQVVGLGEFVSDGSNSYTAEEMAERYGRPLFVSGQAKPPGSNYTRFLVMARTKEENVTWVDQDKLDVIKKIYVADDQNAPLHPPQNRGHEAMIYLTYIIDHYDSLPDISIFMHAHQWSWHNNDILNNDAAEMIRRLSSERVMREGYMNLRCHWNPGCPDWMHPGKVDEDNSKLEETMMAKCWSEIFPGQAIPQVLAQPCCAQFALSRDRIRSVKRSRYEFYREWLYRTDLRDSISGRIWEYLWHVVFTGQSQFCPDQFGCYCDGYGVCFEGSLAFEKWFEIRGQLRETQTKLIEVREKGGDALLEADYERMMMEFSKSLDEGRWVAMERGRDPRIRAESVGRTWKEGDGF